MANYKVEISKRFGQYTASFFDRDEGPKDEPGTYKTLDDVVKYVRAEFVENVEDEDVVLFRNNSYTSLGELEREVRRAPY